MGEDREEAVDVVREASDQIRRAFNNAGMTPRDPERIPVVLAEIERIWRTYPDLRLAQLLLNIREWNYNLEDDELLIRLRKMYP